MSVIIKGVGGEEGSNTLDDYLGKQKVEMRLGSFSSSRTFFSYTSLLFSETYFSRNRDGTDLHIEACSLD